MIEKCTLNRFIELVSGNVVALVGAGKKCKDFLNKVDVKDGSEIIICDNSKSLQNAGLIVNGKKYQVCQIEKIGNYDKNKIIVVITTIYYVELYEQIKKLFGDGIRVFIYPFIESREVIYNQQIKKCLNDYHEYNHFDESERDEFVQNEYEKLKLDGRMVIPYMPVFLTTKCSLNCDKCNNLIPDIKEKRGSFDFSINKVKSSLETILNNVQELTFCEFVGGEPFLFNHLAEMIEYAGNQRKIRQIIIITNGTVIPSEEILCLLHKYNVIVRISDYGLFEKIAKLVAVLEKNDINVKILQDMKWLDSGNIKARGRSDEEIHFQYNRCEMSIRCKCLYEDSLYTCARIAGLAMLNAYNESEDVLNINDTLTEHQLRNFYLHETGHGCDYCDMCAVAGGKMIKAAEQRGKNKLERSQYTIIRNDELEHLLKK